MVLPLIPAVLIAVGAATGSGGLALGGKGAWGLKQAQSRGDAARKQYEERRKVTENALATANRRMHELGNQQQQAIVDVVLRMADFLRRHDRQVRENERLLVDGLKATVSQLDELRTLTFDAKSWIEGAVGSATVAIGTGTGVTAVAGMVGVASTGAAISGLSGAAAESAAMAWLGGGSLAAGGGGMALGATALNFVTLGPALLVGGFVAHGQGNKAITKAREIEAQVAVEIARFANFDAHLDVVKARANELSMVLTELARKGIDAIDLLESEPFDAHEHASRFQNALMHSIAVRDVAVAPVIDCDGELTESSAELTLKYREMANRKDDA